MASLFTSYSNAQDYVSSNLITNPSFANGTTGWIVNSGNGAAGVFAAGGGTAYQFGYIGGTISQSIAVNQALAAAGTGINVSGLQYGWQYANYCKNKIGGDGSCLDPNGIVDQFSANVSLTNSAGANVYSRSFEYNTWAYAWKHEAQDINFTSPYALTGLSTLNVSFSGIDSGYWAGLYGPVVTNVYAKLKYSVDPCATNAAYSSTCAGFGNIVNSNNLLNSTVGGSSLNQAFAINTALENAGVGALVHGFNYGFNWRVGTGWFGCTAWNQDGSCSWNMNIPAYANATVSLTNSSNQSLFSKTYNFSTENTSGSVSDKYLLPSSMNQSLLGTGRITGSASGTNSSIEGAWATLIYTPDPCFSNPLYSPDCKGYALAISKQLAPVASSTSLTYNDGSQTVDSTTGAPVDPAQPAPPPGSPPPPPPGYEPPPGSPPPTSGPQPASNNNPAGPPPANQPPPQGGSSSQPRAGEVKTAGDNKSSSSSPVSLSSVMSMISSNQTRIGNEAKSVVQAAEAQATQSASAAQQQAETVASTAVAQSTSSGTTGGSVSFGTSARTSTQTQVSAFALPTGAQSTTSSIEAIRPPVQAAALESSQSTGSGLTTASMPYQFGTTTTQSTSSTVSAVESPVLNFGFQLPGGRNTFQSEPDVIPQNEGIKIGSRSTLNDAMESRSVLLSATTQEQKTDAVNKNVQPNELAGGVDIRTMATQPTGYQAYSIALPDVAFYAPREIYKNQVNVDNARLLRGLGSDRLHQEMVNQQYKIGN